MKNYRKHSLEQSHWENRPSKRFSLDSDEVEQVKDLFKAPTQPDGTQESNPSASSPTQIITEDCSHEASSHNTSQEPSNTNQIIDHNPQPIQNQKLESQDDGTFRVAYTIVTSLPSYDDESSEETVGVERDQTKPNNKGKNREKEKNKNNDGENVENVRIIDQERMFETVKDLVCKQKILRCPEDQNFKCILDCGRVLRGKIDLKRHLCYHVKLLESQLKVKKRIEKNMAQ